MNTPAFVAYVLCCAVSAACAFLLLRSWRRSGSRLVMWCGTAFVLIAASNAALVVDLMVLADLSILRAALIALGLGLLIYGIALEDPR